MLRLGFPLETLVGEFGMYRVVLPALLALLLVKLGYEQLRGPMPMHNAALRALVLVDAHAYGALGGAAIAVLLWAAARYNPRPEPA